MIRLTVFIYLVLTVLLGLLLSKRIKSASDFLVAGRNLGLPLITATLAAVQIGAGVILGGAELGAASGMWPGMWYGIGCGGGLIVAGWLVASKLRKHGGYVPLDFFAYRYGEKRWIRIWGWLSNIPSLLGIFVAQIMAAGSIFSIFGFDFKPGVLISGIAVLLYSFFGGMLGSAVVNLFQISIIIVGIPLVAVTAAARLAETSSTTLGQVLSTPFIPQGMFSRAVFIIIPFLLSISVSYDAFMRYQSAKSAKVAQWGSILGGFIVIIVSFCIGLIGSIGKILSPSLDNASVLPHTIQSTLSPVFAGIVVAALLAAVMSTGNCLLISLAGCFSRDLYNKVFNPEAKLDELRHSKNISKMVIVFASVAGILFALQAKGILYTIIIFNYPYMGSMLIPLLGGVLWPKATTKGAVAAVFVGGAIGVGAFFFGIPSPWQGIINIDLGLFIAYALSAVVFISVSLSTQEAKL